MFAYKYFFADLTGLFYAAGISARSSYGFMVFYWFGDKYSINTRPNQYFIGIVGHPGRVYESFSSYSCRSLWLFDCNYFLGHFNRKDLGLFSSTASYSQTV